MKISENKKRMVKQEKKLIQITQNNYGDESSTHQINSKELSISISFMENQKL